MSVRETDWSAGESMHVYVLRAELLNDEISTTTYQTLSVLCT